MKEALAFEQQMSEYYYKQNFEDFKATYCENFVKEKSEKFANHNKFICGDCAMELIGEKQLKEHLNTRKHKANMTKAKKKNQ